MAVIRRRLHLRREARRLLRIARMLRELDALLAPSR